MLASPSRGLIFVISGPSGVGKTTLCDRLLASENVRRVITATTRTPRNGELHGRDYFFLTESDFRQRISAGAFVEHAEVYGRLYGTPRDQVEEALAAGHGVLLNVDVQGAESIRASGLPILTIFIAPPSFDELEARLRQRSSEGEDILQRRLDTARAELGEASRYEKVVINDSLERALAELRQLVRERLPFTRA